ncbi:kinase-like domain-containing protein [Annulohypoxylon maeteangense]|uniref:kinase-like domain-containing protein n=1 Tax=Annulohypoxylon maeteangense TaxID=1927788 RepID=UPI0020079C3F|nr:kinase-like domain-containing protein [Annulohypoxylon maeteangense]KAI0888370.1 kinase-like domain-containing protein [Annulohypoxylon maeteangense]
MALNDGLPALPELSFIRRSYTEKYRKNNGNENQQQDEGSIYRTELIFKHINRKWHVKVTLTLKSMIQLPEINAKWLQRKKDFEDLCRCINFSGIPLLEDTVTELILSNDLCDPELHLLPQSIRFRIQEDPERIRFPLYDGGGIPTIDWSAIQKGQEFAAGVHKVYIKERNQHCVYKEVDRPLYEPHDTEVLQQELRNLVLLRNTKGIVQILAVVISANPYQTDERKDSEVLRGILLEYHPYGTLQDLLRSKSETSYPWRRWAVQVATALNLLHRHQLSHLDLKPANIVVSIKWDALLIDISGLAVTQEWLSPEMAHVFAPWEQDIGSRIQNDVSAFGKLLSRMADATGNHQEAQLLKHVASLATAEVPIRISLLDAISMLQN